MGFNNPSVAFLFTIFSFTVYNYSRWLENINMAIKYIIGIDEVGRGPLAGPVAIGMMVIEIEKYQDLLKQEIFQPGKDSKKLTPKKRAEYFFKINELKEQQVLNYGVFFESNNIIDKFGIVGAINMAIKKGLLSLGDEPEKVQILLDGWLKAPAEYLNQKSIIKGDESELVISLASIVAKVIRDNKMEALAEDFVNYDLKNNKGYGTAKHIAGLRLYGPCKLHRRSF